MAFPGRLDQYYSNTPPVSPPNPYNLLQTQVYELADTGYYDAGRKTFENIPATVRIVARAILDRQEKAGDNWRDKNTDYYFPGHIKGTHFNDGSWGKLKKELDKQSGVTGWQVRDLRRTFRSSLARLGVAREIAEIMLNHVTGGGKTDLDEIYDRYDYLQEKRAALQKLEAHLKKLVK